MDKVARHTSPGISYALSYGFSYRFLSSLPSHRFSIPFSVSSLPFNVGVVCLLATRWEKEKERRRRKEERKEATWNWKREKTVGLSRGILFSGWSCTRAWVGWEWKKEKAYLMVVIFVPGLLLEMEHLFFGVWKDLDRLDLVNIYLVRYNVFLEIRDFDLKISLQFSFGAKKSKREEKYRNGSIKFNGHNTGRFVIKQMTID